MDTLNPHMTSLHIFKNDNFCGSLDLNELRNGKLELELHFLTSNLLPQKIFVKCNDVISVMSYEDLECSLKERRHLPTLERIQSIYNLIYNLGEYSLKV